MGSSTDWKHAASCPECAARFFGDHDLRVRAGMNEFLKAGFTEDQIKVITELQYRDQTARELHQPDMVTMLRTKDGKAQVRVISHVHLV